ncbi:hypothetical protein [Alicyclobacillus dauci]|uniref:Uncharacterized protein n=1 Tax=Alicyclobacillus dauci TaxID=1475485 RepID=A0ABY6Z822_9BACL|nr:hypothetical protein [Alicyclobacillus dauci]WAH38848.1 hypothetical protein NZD86_10395 [Alicyclobacillus dauci]
MKILSKDTDCIEIQPSIRTIRIGQVYKIMFSEGMLDIEPGTIRVLKFISYEEVPTEHSEPFMQAFDVEPTDKKECAVSPGARLPLVKRRGSEDRPLGHPSYLNAKARGENSMVGKRETNRRRLGRCRARPA